MAQVFNLCGGGAEWECGVCGRGDYSTIWVRGAAEQAKKQSRSTPLLSNLRIICRTNLVPGIALL